LNQQNEKVLKNILDDNEMLNNKLNQALDMLIGIREPNRLDVPQTNPKKYYNNLQASNLLLVGLSTVCAKSGRSMTSSQPVNNPQRSKATNELIGYQMLEQFSWVNSAIANSNETDAINSFDKLEKLLDKIKLSRSTVHSRLYQTTDTIRTDSETLLNFCNHCKGQIKIV